MMKRFISISLVCLTLMGCAHAVTMSDGTKCHANGLINKQPCYYGPATKSVDVMTFGETTFQKEAKYHVSPGSMTLGVLGALSFTPIGWAASTYLLGFRLYQPEKDNKHNGN